MQFIYTKPEFRTYRGHEFFGGNPVTILDNHTKTLLMLNPDFIKVQDEKQLQEAKAPEEEVKTGLHGREIITLKNKGGRPKGSKNKGVH